jgi:putative FmdB family regulatory protein
MPTYEYECSKGHVFEVEQSITAEPLKRCKVCRAKVRRLISASHFILKGSGWYADGYGSVKKSSGDSSSDAKSDTKSESKSDAKSETKSESKSDSKSDSKSESKPKSSEKSKTSKAASGS